MGYKTMVAISLEDSELPSDMILKTTEMYPLAAGYAFAKDGIVLIDIFCSVDIGDKKGVDLNDAISKTETEFKGEKVFWWFVDAVDAPITEASFQPFNLMFETGENGKATLVVMMDGTFIPPEGSDIDENEMPEYNFAANYLAPKIDAIALGAGGSLDKILLALNNSKFKEDLQMYVKPSGMMLVIAGNGKNAYVDVMHKGSCKYDWGFISNNDIGLATPVKDAAAAKATPAAAVPAPRSLARRGPAATTTVSPHGTPLNPPKEPHPDEHPPLVEPLPEGEMVFNSVNLVKLTGSDIIWARPDRKMDWKSALTWWNRNVDGGAPTVRNPDLIYRGVPTDKLKQGSPVKDFLNKLENSGPFRSAMETAQKERQEKELRAASGADNKTPEPQQLSLPFVVPAASKKNFLEMVRSQGGDFDTPAADLVAQLTKHEKFSTQVGMDPHQILNWKAEAFIRMDKPSLFNWCLELQLMLWDKAPELFSVWAKKKAETAAAAAATKPIEQKATGTEGKPAVRSLARRK